MGLLKKGMEGNEVKELQELLRELDYDVPLSGIFDHETYKAVRSFQASHLDKHDQPLVVDGKVGPLTMWALQRSEEHTSELQSLMRISYAVFCLKKKNKQKSINTQNQH